ncbi:hypothetical protein KDA23_06065, partial [Candidatus Saccharibacteria bacterium]|nr:hypothetical protein [Candidatus Saccharibacteria bacterium]
DQWQEDNGRLIPLTDTGTPWCWKPVNYYVTAKWGYGDAPDDLLEVVMQTVVNIWQGRQAGKFSDVVKSPQGGAVGYEKAFTDFQKTVLLNLKNDYEGFVV